MLQKCRLVYDALITEDSLDGSDTTVPESCHIPQNVRYWYMQLDFS
jgi:hypothetical protein